MITAGDDYPLHNDARPVRDPGTERNLYDRFFFNAYSPAADAYVSVAFGLYPGRNIMDAAFGAIVDGVQHNVRASRLLGADRLDTRVGPITVRIDEPLRVLTVTVDDEPSGIAASLTFTARGPVFEEGRYHFQPSHRTLFDYTRLTQNGSWSGSITIDGTTIDAAGWLGTRDRSWGIRPVGERETGAPEIPAGFYWVWAPLNFGDACALFDSNEHPDGRPWHREAMWAPAGGLDGPVDRGKGSIDIDFKPGTRHARSATLHLEMPSGERSILLTPVVEFVMQGIGYTHPTWGHGMYVGDDVRAYESWKVDEVDEQAFGNQHIQALVRAERDDGTEGLGILEQLIFGPHQPSGFQDWFDFAG